MRRLMRLNSQDEIRFVLGTKAFRNWIAQKRSYILQVQSPRWRNAQLILSSNNEQDKTKEQDNSCCGSYREVSTAPDVPEFATDSLTRILTNV
uniref:Uncharacterized protein n=1 Tax=Vespula pensylvanica TaxID=30213 RepID=A0A834P045_VESPE|nr:hypothetical protein H0235_009884 [Vespula pensylvanica]